MVKHILTFKHVAFIGQRKLATTNFKDSEEQTFLSGKRKALELFGEQH